MPVDLLQAQNQIREKCRQTVINRAEKARRVEQAGKLLKENCGNIPALVQRVEKALVKNPALRCAVPCEEPLDQTAPAGSLVGEYVVLAADGSQIVPSRHDAVEFGVINTGVFRMAAGGPPARAPVEITRTRLLYGDELENPARPVTDELVAIWRDLEERRFLVELAARESLPVFALTDGPLELYHEPRQQEEFADLFQSYLSQLSELTSLGASPAGYVDRPRADLVVRLLELAALDEKDLDQAGRYRPLAGVTDLDVFSTLLKPGERSAVFRMQSISSRKYTGDLSLHFFYLNAGFQNRNTFARVEIPACIAQNSERVGRVHAVLLEQCGHLSNRPYPYALHRAHEIAVVRRDEKQALEEMILSELSRLGSGIGAPSNKQFHKDQSGIRTRYKS